MKAFIVSILGIFGILLVVGVPVSGIQFAWNIILTTSIGILMCWMSYKLAIVWKLIDINEKI